MSVFHKPSLLALLLANLVVTAHAVELNIPAQPLDKALNSLAHQTGERIIFSTALTEQKQASALKGDYTLRQALEKLLTGSGLELKPMQGGGYTLVKHAVIPHESEPVQLSEVSVSGSVEQERANGRVKGYVARRNSTATKTDSAILEAPQSVSVITRDQMTMQAVQSVGEALRYSAGIVAEANGPDPRADTIGMRGFSIGRDQFRDGLRNYAFNNQGGTVVEPFGLERVEVLRGPSSILYGQGAPGGLVNLVSKRPTDAPLHEVGITLGQYDRKQIHLDMSDLLSDDGAWSYRVVGLIQDSDTQIDHVKDDRIYIAPSLTWRPSEFTTLTLLTDYQKNDRGQGYQAWPRIGTLENSQFGKVSSSRFLGEPGLDKYEQERYAVGYQFEHIFNNTFTFRQNLRYQRMTTDAISTYLRALQADQRTITRETGGNEDAVDNLVVDSHLQAKWAHGAFEHTVLAGMDSQRLNNDQRRTFALAGTLDIYAPVYGVTAINPVESANIEQHQRQTGAYLQDQIKYDGKWVATVGGRKDWTRMETDNLRTPSASSSQKDEAETWRTGLVYLAENGLAPYASYTESFLPVIGTSFGGAAFKPETGEQYELGLRYQPKDSQSLFSLALFDLRRQNVTTLDVQNPTFQIQQGEVRSRGVELEMKTQFDAWSLIGSYAYTDPEITKSNNRNAQGVGFQGKDPNHVARNTAALWADYHLPSTLIEGMTIGGGVRYIGTRYGDDANTIKLPSYTLVDLALRYQLVGLGQHFKGWQLALNASNLFDKEYVATCGYYGDGCRWGFRRNVMANLTYRW
ncbi:TonB-dependent siderophore receptor [Methylophilus aquaticus]|uniref:TonB-dependent siderophore receptor n=1 Tax=Methylophilus aquaticus TaxID=1971610 RepID=A0ABT9JUT4_9PROT|nr:TonB-dependent siderophore receptor [Methylophilus aquaticus]MDP8568347.1 TonB-dependent siderophore receptor [Methylophilus aquaticus]